MNLKVRAFQKIINLHLLQPIFWIRMTQNDFIKKRMVWNNNLRVIVYHSFLITYHHYQQQEPRMKNILKP